MDSVPHGQDPWRQLGLGKELAVGQKNFLNLFLTVNLIFFMSLYKLLLKLFAVFEGAHHIVLRGTNNPKALLCLGNYFHIVTRIWILDYNYYIDATARTIEQL